MGIASGIATPAAERTYCLLTPLCSGADENEAPGDLCWFPFKHQAQKYIRIKFKQLPLLFLNSQEAE